MKKIVSVFLFVVKTVYFSPVNNPILYCLIVVSGLLLAGGELKKHETVLFLLLAAISHRLMPAIHLSASNSSENQNEIFSQGTKLLPIKKNTFYISFLLSGILYISLLLIFGYYAGKNSENPPIVESLCPPRTITAYTPSGEPYRYVEGVTVYGSKFQIPVSPSLLFQYLASDIIFPKEKVTEAYIQRFCPCQKKSPEKIFSVKDQDLSSVRFSSFLEDVRYNNNLTLLLIIIFSFVFFFYDGMSIFQSRAESRGNKIFLFTIMNFLLYSAYGLLCSILIIDILLPESMITQISSKVSFYKLLLPILVFAIVSCCCRFLTFLFDKENR